MKIHQITSNAVIFFKKDVPPGGQFKIIPFSEISLVNYCSPVLVFDRIGELEVVCADISYSGNISSVKEEKTVEEFLFAFAGFKKNI